MSAIKQESLLVNKREGLARGNCGFLFPTEEATFLIVTASTNLGPIQLLFIGCIEVLSTGAKAGKISIPPLTLAKCQDKECVQRHVCMRVASIREELYLILYRKYDLTFSIY
jgi:hypothetical protein